MNRKDATAKPLRNYGTPAYYYGTFNTLIILNLKRELSFC